MTRARFVYFACLLTCILCLTPLIAQESDTGLPRFGSFQGSNFDAVNLKNGSLHVEIPLFSFARRAAPPLTYRFVYDMPTWYATQASVTPTTFEWRWGSADGEKTGWNLLTTPNGFWYTKHDIISRNCVFSNPLGGPDTTVNYTVHTNYVVYDTEGTAHPFEVRHVDRAGECNVDVPAGNQSTGIALDGSGITITIGANAFSTTVSMPNDDGPKNGNIDAGLGGMSRTVQTDANGNWLSEVDMIQDSNGNPQQFRIDYAPITLHTDFCDAFDHGADACYDVGPDSLYLPQKLTLPTGRFYTFTWSSDGNADLLRIDLPTGGYTSYTYSTGVGGANIIRDGGGGRGRTIIHRVKARRFVTGRTVSDGAVTGTWSYSTANGGITVHDPAGNEQVHIFGQAIDSASGSTGAGTSFETQVRFYQGAATSGTLLKTINREYTGETSTRQVDAAYHGMINVRLTRETVVLNDGSQSKTETDYEMFSQQFIDPSYTFPVTRLNPIEKREYDYGSGAPGPLRRRTTFAYLHTGNQNYLSRNIVRQVVSKTVYDGIGNQIAQTVNEYDNYSHPGQPMVASGAIQHDSAYDTSFTYRGNITAVSRWRNTDSAMLTTTNQYDDAGNVVSTKDPLGNLTQFDYTDSWGNMACAPASPGQAKMFVTKTTDALGHITRSSYNSCTGTVASSTDMNSQVTTYAYDLMNRRKQVNFPDGGQTSICYGDVSGTSCYSGTGSLQTVATTKIDATTNLVTSNIYDGLGRVKQTQLNSDPQGVTYTDFTFDAVGRKASQSNPYRDSGHTAYLEGLSYGTTFYFYDGLDRLRTVNNPDGSTVNTSYIGNCATTTDEAGKSRRSCSDALGRLTNVWEDPASLNYETDYQYDTLDNLVRVDQKGDQPGNSSQWRTRTFAYDSLSRLVCAANPEITSSDPLVLPAICPNPDSAAYTAGTTRYSYDASGNLLTKKMPKANQSSGSVVVTTSYSYDSLNRLTQKSYNDGATPTVRYGYDGVAPSGCTPPSVVSQPTWGISSTPSYVIGRRSSMCDGAGGAAWVYDSMGRPTLEQRLLGSVSKTIGYQYYLDGPVWRTWYPNGEDHVYSKRTAAGREFGAIDDSTGVFPNASFYPNGALRDMHFVAPNFAQIYVNRAYNKRLQPLLEYALVAASPAQYLYQRCYDFHMKGGVSGSVGGMTCSFPDPGSGPGDNGNVYQVQNQMDANRTQNFTYDSLNRIASGYSNGSNWGQSFLIDAWGNMTHADSIAGKNNPGAISFPPATVKNQLAGFTYDAAGNPIAGPGQTVTFDAENRVICLGPCNAQGVWTYTYDGDGKRVKKSNGSTGTLYWTGVGSDALSESDLSGNINEDYFYFNGQRSVRVDRPSNVGHFYVNDRLGTASIVATPATHDTVTFSDSDYSPYGIEIPVAGSDANHYKFTGKERDAESGLDNFGARYFTAALGRFMTPDWAARPTAVPYAVFGDPQSLNLYDFVRDNPVNHVDVDGHCADHYQDGTCKVNVDPATGQAGARAGKQLEGVLNKYDKAVNALNDKDKFNIKNTNGKIIGSMTGKEIKAVWNGTSFDVTNKSFNNGGAGGGTGGTWKGDSFKGTSELNPQAVTAYANNASARKESQDVGVSTLTFHELAHETHFGEALTQQYPVTPKLSQAREEGTSSAGRRMSDAVSAPFDCAIPGGCQ